MFDSNSAGCDLLCEAGTPMLYGRSLPGVAYSASAGSSSGGVPAEQSFDAIVSVFAPCPAAEFRRVLRGGAALVVAFPGATHLSQLRGRLYAKPLPLPPRAHTDPDMQVHLP